jgi:hypothetical protein
MLPAICSQHALNKLALDQIIFLRHAYGQENLFSIVRK